MQISFSKNYFEFNFEFKPEILEIFKSEPQYYRNTDPIHLPEKLIPEITFPQKALGRNDIFPNLHFPEGAFARNYIFLKVH